MEGCSKAFRAKAEERRGGSSDGGVGGEGGLGVGRERTVWRVRNARNGSRGGSEGRQKEWEEAEGEVAKWKRFSEKEVLVDRAR